MAPVHVAKRHDVFTLEFFEIRRATRPPTPTPARFNFSLGGVAPRRPRTWPGTTEKAAVAKAALPIKRRRETLAMEGFVFIILITMQCNAGRRPVCLKLELLVSLFRFRLFCQIFSSVDCELCDLLFP